MKSLKKSVLFIAILALAVLNILIYMNSHYYYRARKHQDPKQKIALLERSGTYGPSSDLVFYELGKSYFDLGVDTLGQGPESESYFKKAAQSLRKSIRINPASPYSHFYLGQSLLHLDLLSYGKETGYFGEFRNAATLAGDDHQIYREVAKLFLSRWADLSEEDRRFTLSVLKKTMARRNSEEIAELMVIWELNSKDYRIMDESLPLNVPLYRQYADFLGEKSLSLEERHKYMSLADFLDFERARRECQSAEGLLTRFRIKEAFARFKSSLDLLRGVKFYQTLHAENTIDTSEYLELLRSNLLGLAKCRVEEKSGWGDVEGYLREYVALEDQAIRVEELEDYLRDRGVLAEKLSRTSGDLSRLALELLLQFKQNRYREIINFGRDLQRSFMVVPEAESLNYVRILQIVGDSLQKVDFLYDAGDIYLKALEVDPNNLEALLRIRQNYSRLNEDRKLREVERTIEGLLAPREINLNKLALDKRKTFSRPLVFDGQNIVLDLEFFDIEKTEPPIVTVLFNRRVVWEDFVNERIVSLNLATKIGENTLQIMPINRSVILGKLSYHKRSL